MSLNYDQSNVADYKTLHDDKAEWRKTVDIIHLCMLTDIGTITKDNYHQWYFRYMLRDSISSFGPSHPDQQIKLSDVKRRIGLKTNVFDTTDAKFFALLKKQYKQRISDAQWKEQRDAEKEAEETARTLDANLAAKNEQTTAEQEGELA